MRLNTVRWTSHDGLGLAADDWRPEREAKTPLLCLAGLTRNAKDFEPLRAWLPQDRRVICPDYRGRGRSQYADDPKTYTPMAELQDIIGLLDTLGLARVAVIGTSRGGIVAMLMAAAHKHRLAGALLNDVGPVLDKAGLIRIRTNLDAGAPRLETWDDAVAYLQARDPGYETLGAAEWLAMAKRIFRDDNGKPRPDFDPQILAAFMGKADIEAGKAPEMWPLYDTLRGLPLAVLRGAKSDLLSAATVSRMTATIKDMAATEVPDRGHIPLLDEPRSRAAITIWLARVDAYAATNM